MPETAIGLIAKYPEVGQVKTRLAASIGPERATSVYRRLLQQTCNVITGLDPSEFFRSAFVTPADQVVRFGAAYRGFEAYQAQSNGDLGIRMRSAFDWQFASRKVKSAILIGADCPELSLELIQSVPQLLEVKDLVLGPSHDGGYYLIGLKRTQEAIFSEIPWGTGSVLRETMAAAHAANLKVAHLPILRDLDDDDDLNYFFEKGVLTS